MSVTPQNLPIPQTQAPSAASSSLCPAGGRPAKPASCSFAGPTTTRKPWCSSNRVALCQATLSIGLYLPLEGPVPTTQLYLSRRRVNLSQTPEIAVRGASSTRLGLGLVQAQAPHLEGREWYLYELRRIPLPRTRVHRGKKT